MLPPKYVGEAISLPILSTDMNETLREDNILPLYNKVTHPKRVKNGIIEITLWIGSRPSDAGMRSVPVGYDHDLKREG